MLYLMEVLLFSWFVVPLSVVGENLLKEAQRWRLLDNKYDLRREAVLVKDLFKQKKESSSNTNAPYQPLCRHWKLVYLQVLPADGHILSLLHHHQVITDDCWWSLMALQVDFNSYCNVQMDLSPSSQQSSFCALLPRSRRHIKAI